MSADDARNRTAASNRAPARASGWLGRIALGTRAAATRLRFLAIFALVFAVLGSWETISVYWAKLTTSATSAAVISSDTEYFCPMDPGVIADWPSRCPICHMSLVRRKRGEAAPLPDGVVARMQFTPYRLFLGGIGVTPVAYRPLRREFDVPGRFTTVGENGGGLVEASLFARELVWLEPGQNAEVTLLRDGGARALAATLREVPDTSGGSLGPVTVRLDVDCPAGSARPGDPVRARFRCPAERLPGFRELPSQPPPLREKEPRRVYQCMNHPDVVRSEAGTCPQDKLALMARPLLANQRVRWWCPMHPEVTSEQPGASCAACGGMLLVPRVISYRLPGTVLSIPASAVIDDGVRSLAYVEHGDGMFDARLVTLGPRCGGWFPVVSGLEPGDRVVTQGAFLVDAETRLNPSLAASYFGAGAAASGREPAAQPAPAPAGEEWLLGLDPSDRALALRQKTCPVTGRPLGSMGAPGRVEVKGKIVFLCCDGCAAAIQEHPERYLSEGSPGAGRREEPR